MQRPLLGNPAAAVAAAAANDAPCVAAATQLNTSAAAAATLPCRYALTGKEVKMILMQRLVKVDGKARTDTTYPAGFMDVITLDKTDDHFRCGVLDFLYPVDKDSSRHKQCTLLL
jgi:hypothetical protein